ncbi:MAG: ATP-binding protein [Gammaproteobacteria bacterium]|nr:ATP-binding protein [Gammaproteobacteria bacterium]
MQQQLLHQRFAAQSEQLRQVREWVREAALATGMNEEKTGRVVIGVNEACMNIITHAYGDLHGDIVLDITREGSQITIRLTDFAKTVDCSTIKSRDLDDIRPGGLGVHFIHEVMDEVNYLPGENGNGNVVIMKVGIES